MIRKTLTTVAAAAVIVTASFGATSAAEAASKRERIIAGVAIGVAAALLGAEVNAGRKGKHSHGQQRKGGKHQRAGFRTHCENLPVFRGGKMVGFQQVCD